MSRIIRMLTAATAAGGLALVGLVTAGAAALASAAPAGAAAGSLPIRPESMNWAGYYATAPSGQKVEGVTANMVVPSVSCKDSVGSPLSAGGGTGPYEAVFWVGIGGAPKTGLEQVGIAAECRHKVSLPKYFMFWEMVPAGGPHDGIGGLTIFRDGNGVPYPVSAGDHVRMAVLSPDMSAPGQGYYEMDLDVLSGPNAGRATKFEKLDPGTVSGTTADVISEWTDVSTLYGLGKAGLADFGTVIYHDAQFTTWAAKPYELPVTQHKITMVHYGPFKATAISTGAPWTAPHDTLPGSSFSNTFTGGW
jgi:hypothetical protein